MTEVIPGRSEPTWYSVLVKDGVVTMEGTPKNVPIGHNIVRRARHVQGVVAVRRDRLVYPVPPVPEQARPLLLRPGPQRARPLQSGPLARHSASQAFIRLRSSSRRASAPEASSTSHETRQVATTAMQTSPVMSR